LGKNVLQRLDFGDLIWEAQVEPFDFAIAV
jgi:hypothetical protein